MNKLQLLSLEITSACNRGREHTACPNQHPERWINSVGRRPMTDDQRFDVACRMYAGGFCGMVAFHYYCEPLVVWDRLRNLIRNIKERHANARFLLWTNGDLFDWQNLSKYKGYWDKIIVTNYGQYDLEPLKDICPDVSEHWTTQLDWRANPPSHYGASPHCYRPFLEMIFDFYGNVHACCMDWKGEAQIGNIHDVPFEKIWRRWDVLRNSLAHDPMLDGAPPRCLRCGTRFVNLATYVAEPADNVKRYLDSLTKNPRPRQGGDFVTNCHKNPHTAG